VKPHRNYREPEVNEGRNRGGWSVGVATGGLKAAISNFSDPKGVTQLRKVTQRGREGSSGLVASREFANAQNPATSISAQDRKRQK